MPAGINDKFTETTNGSRPVPTTLTALLGSGASPGTATCGALTGWPTTTAVHFIIYTLDTSGHKVANSQTDWKGIVSGNTITNLTLKAGTNNGYSIGAVVEAAPTAAWADDVVEGIAVQHNQDGTHKSVTTDTLTASGAIQGATVVATGDVSDNSIALKTIRSETIFDYVASGCVLSGTGYGSTLTWSLTSGVVYIGGKRLTVASATGTVTASKDTYFDLLDPGTGSVATLVNTGANIATNNAASPALAASSIRIGIIVSGASNIANAAAVNQGQEDRVLPIASSVPYSVTDSLGNLICPRDPQRKILGLRRITSPFSTASASQVQITGLSVPFIAPGLRKIKSTLWTHSMSNSAANGYAVMGTWNGVVASGTQTSEATANFFTASAEVPGIATSIDTLAAGTYTYNAGLRSGSTSNTAIINASTVYPAYLLIELE